MTWLILNFSHKHSHVSLDGINTWDVTHFCMTRSQLPEWNVPTLSHVTVTMQDDSHACMSSLIAENKIDQNEEAKIVLSLVVKKTSFLLKDYFFFSL